MPSITKENFFELSEADLKELLVHGREHVYAKGETLFNEGDDADSIWLVRKGRVNISKSSPEGGESLVAFYTAGQTFCVAASIINDPYPCKSVAATDVEAIAIPSQRFRGLFEKLPRFAKRLLTEMAPQFCAAHCDCALAMESVDMRLAHATLRLDRQFQGGGIPFTRSELARMVNTTVETCIRTLSSWEKKGWIKSERGSFALKDRDALEDLIA